MSENIYTESKKWAQEHNISFWYQNKVSSTNDIAKFGDKDYTLFLTEHQHQGRGRAGRSWADTDDGSQLLSSWTFKSNEAPQQFTAPLMGLGVFQALKTIWPDIEFGLKAPNDIMIENKKVAGLLTEVVSQGSDHKIIIGLGLNVFKTPKVDVEACCLKDYISPQKITDHWDHFLTQLYGQLKSRLTESCKDSLSKDNTDDLLEALSQCSQKIGPIEQVLPDGSLKTKDKTYHWSEI